MEELNAKPIMYGKVCMGYIVSRGRSPITVLSMQDMAQALHDLRMTIYNATATDILSVLPEIRLHKCQYTVERIEDDREVQR